MSGSNFATLRELLSEHPTRELWNQLIWLFDSWEDEMEVSLAVEYAQEHMKEWPDELRHWNKYQLEHDAISLFRSITFPRWTFDSFQELRSLNQFPWITGLDLSSHDINEFQSIPTLPHIKTLRLVEVRGFDSFEGIHGCFPNLESIEFQHSYFVESFDGLERLPSLRSIAAFECGGLESMYSISQMSRLETLRINGCFRLEDVTCLKDCSTLRKLSLDAERWVGQSSEFYQSFGSLEELQLDYCETLWELDVEVLSTLPVLRSLHLIRAEGLYPLPALEKLRGLEELSIHGADGIEDWSGLAKLTRLKTLRLAEANFASSPTFGKSNPELEHVDLMMCKGIKNLDFLSTNTKLKTLDLFQCGDLEELCALKELKALETLNLMDCTPLRELSAIAELPELRSLLLWNLPNLAIEPESGALETRKAVESYLQRWRK